MKSDGNGRNGRSHTHFYVREHGADSRTQADKKGEKQTHRNGQKGGSRRAYGCFGMPWFRCLLFT